MAWPGASRRTAVFWPVAPVFLVGLLLLSLVLNLGGAIVPASLAGDLIVHTGLGWPALVAVAMVSGLVHGLACRRGARHPARGGDVLNLGRVRALGAPVVSIGGAGTFDGIYLPGVIAVLIASL
jgi:uncharacterized membrane protein